jgi:cutinase
LKTWKNQQIDREPHGVIVHKLCTVLAQPNAVRRPATFHRQEASILALAVSSLLLIVLNVSLGSHAHAEESATSSLQSDARPPVPTIIAFPELPGGLLMLMLPNVPGATSFIVQQPDRKPVQLPATESIYLLHMPISIQELFDKTKVIIAPQPVSVVALQGERELARFTTYTPCPTMAFIAARGSGQDHRKGTYGLGLGNRGYKVMMEMQRQLGANLRTLPAIAVDYPAVAVGVDSGQIAIGNISGVYRKSVKQGVEAAHRVILRSIVGCPQTLFILFGYSQGAQVMGDAFAMLSKSQRNHVARVILFADATYRSHDPRVSYKPKPLPHYGIKGAHAPFPTGDTAVIES